MGTLHRRHVCKKKEQQHSLASKIIKYSNETNTVFILCLFFLTLLFVLLYYEFLLTSNQLVPESSDSNIQRVHQNSILLIVSQFRSGSSWLGEIFNSDVTNFYVFEPFHPQTYQSSKLQRTTAQAQVEILNNICTCNFDGEVPSYGFYERSRGVYEAYSAVFGINTASLREGCTKATERVVKVVRLLDATVISYLKVLNPGCNVRVLHLMRDPRGAILSRMNTFQRMFPEQEIGVSMSDENITMASEKVCRQRLEVLLGLRNIEGVDMHEVLYEELSKHPVQYISTLYSHLSLRVSKETYHYILTSSRSGRSRSGGWDTIKNSRVVYNAWRTHGSPSHIQSVERSGSCKRLIEMYGYT